MFKTEAKTRTFIFDSKTRSRAAKIEIKLKYDKKGRPSGCIEKYLKKTWN